ncbi:MAG: anhydro-N-acetylmuramic acid kinase [Comamonadaceae bacterium]|nr:anhydro-N-acetylmuramic acid kinase [Comamonadaceae bacterium]
MSAHLFVGLMSGTSLDGVDAVLADFSAAPRVLAQASRNMPEELKQELLALNSPGDNELHRAALAANALARLYALTVQDLLAQASEQGIGRHDVAAIGAHGQTVRHRPQSFSGPGYTWQLNNPALLAELTGLDVVADFRTADLAAGGQGAPLVPGFHAALWARSGLEMGVLNIGGISNLTLLPSTGPVTGFDCGPGNALMDHWCQRHTDQAFDAGGCWAASGEVLPDLLNRMLDEPFFTQAPPKSTGRDLFHPQWLASKLAGQAQQLRPQDVQATLTALTASVCADHLLRYLPRAQELLVCGGGALNGQLMHQLQARLPQVRVQPTDARGLPAMQVEASAFAWLAWCWFERQPASRAEVTGARAARVLGALYPATR